ncbi:hypothetical protein OCD85_27365 [Bacillus pacificus]|nr:hypothetical protein [Bacillus pacificus]MCU5364632.1 hypothetical protein [Bacillus pacificus]MCU5402888.1 hypothetical protein [Bacillus pacificus]
MWKCEVCESICEEWEEFCKACENYDESATCGLCGEVYPIQLGCCCQDED